MLVSQFIEDLKVGSASGINLGSNEETGITKFNRSKVISYINSGIADLYTRFPLMVEEKTIELVEDQKTYQIIPEEGKTLLQIKSIQSNLGHEIWLNTGIRELSAYTNRHDTLTLPQLHDTVTSIVVRYTAMPERLSSNCNDDAEIFLPTPLINCLHLFVVGKLYGEKQDQISAGKSAENLARYDEQCRLIENRGMQLEAETTNDRLHVNGWV